MSENIKENKKSAIDIFMEECAAGWNIGIKNIVPSLILGYVLVYILQDTGLMDLISIVFKPVMAVFGLPGEGAAVLISAFFSKASGCGAAAMLYGEGVLTAAQATILYPACILMGTLIGHFARCVLVAGANKKWYALLLLVPIFDALLAMIITKIILMATGLM